MKYFEGDFVKMLELEKLKEILRDNGVIFLNEGDDSDLELDSIQFVSVIVEIEETFHITIPDEMLSEAPKTLKEFSDLINKCLLNTKE